MRILICDDDPLIIEQLQKLIRDYFKLNHVACPELVSYNDGEALLKDKGSKDILFLDVEMPGISGIYIGRSLKKQNKNIIIFIVTSYSEYLDEAMKICVFRYLSKPIEKQRLYRNLKDAINLYNTVSYKLAIETKEGVRTLLSSSFLAIESKDSKVIVHTLSQDFVSVRNMRYWLDILPKNCFFQSHYSFIVNFEHIIAFNHSLIFMKNNMNAYLTKRKYSTFKSAYLLYLESTRQ